VGTTAQGSCVHQPETPSNPARNCKLFGLTSSHLMEKPSPQELKLVDGFSFLGLGRTEGKGHNMKSVALPLVLFLAFLPGCTPDSASEVEAETESSQVEAIETLEAPDAIAIDEEPGETAAESPAPEADQEPAPEADQDPAPEADSESVPESDPEPVEEELADDSIPVLPVVDEIVFSCRNSRLTAEVHAKIPGTKGSEGRFNWGIDSITAYRKNEYGAELDHEMKWDGKYDPEKDKWVSAEASISGARYKDIGDNVRFLIEGRDANGNDVTLAVNQEHGTNC